MLHLAQQLRIDSGQPRQRSRIETIIFSPSPVVQARALWPKKIGAARREYD
jgi:hypothetical protein